MKKDFDTFTETITLEMLKKYAWNSVNAIEDFICFTQGWTPVFGMHGTDAHSKEGRHIEIKTQSFTGNSKRDVALAGKFTFSAPSLDTCFRIMGEQIHVFGKDDLTMEIVYHVSFEGREFVETLINHVNSHVKENSKTKSAPAINYNYNLYKDFKTLEIHEYDEAHMEKYPERWSSEFIKFLIGDIAYYEKFYTEELKNLKVEKISKKFRGNKEVNVLHVEHEWYGVKTVRTLSELKKWNPLSCFQQQIIGIYLDKMPQDPKVCQVEETYYEIVDHIERFAGHTEGILTLKSFRRKVSKLKASEV